MVYLSYLNSLMVYQKRAAMDADDVVMAYEGDGNVKGIRYLTTIQQTALLWNYSLVAGNNNRRFSIRR